LRLEAGPPRSAQGQALAWEERSSWRTRRMPADSPDRVLCAKVMNLKRRRREAVRAENLSGDSFGTISYRPRDKGRGPRPIGDQHGTWDRPSPDAVELPRPERRPRARQGGIRAVAVDTVEGQPGGKQSFRSAPPFPLGLSPEVLVLSWPKDFPPRAASIVPTLGGRFASRRGGIPRKNRKWARMPVFGHPSARCLDGVWASGLFITSVAAVV